MVKVIGIDPGLAATGVGIAEGYEKKIEKYSFGVIKTSPDISFSERLNKIYSGLKSTFIQEKPDLIILEDVFSLAEYPKSGILLGKVTGITILAAERSSIPVRQVTVREAKQILTGNGKADKAQLERAVRNFLKTPVKIKPTHAADALALALIGIFRFGGKEAKMISEWS